MENLNEGKKKKGGMAYEAALREIDAQSAVVALEAKIEKLKEMAETKAQRLEMVSEDENLSELIDKKAMNEMRKEIKQIEKMQEKLEKLYEKKNGKKPEAKKIVDEEEKVDETYGSTTYEEDDMNEDARTDAEEEGYLDGIKDEKEDDVNEEVNRWQKLAGISLQENKIAQAIRDEAKQPDSKVGAAIFNKYAKKIESAPKEDYRKILTSMERELIDKHPDTFDGDDDIVASFMAAK